MATHADDAVDWDRWHDLLDIRDRLSGFTPDEQVEYDRFARIVAKLDAEDAAVASPGVDALVESHERVLASIERLAQAVRDAGEEPKSLRKACESVAAILHNVLINLETVVPPEPGGLSRCSQSQLSFKVELSYVLLKAAERTLGAVLAGDAAAEEIPEKR